MIFEKVSFILTICVALLMLGCNNCRYDCRQGICVNRTCNCDEYWKGDACDKSIFSDYLGSYLGGDNCFISQSKDTVQLEQSSLGPNKLLYAGEIIFDFTTQTQFSLPPQMYRGFEITGEGEILIDRIDFKYNYLDSNERTDCLISSIKL